MKEDNNEDYYLNEKGLITFTSAYLLKRGFCCGSGCRHCPYDYANVPEPRRQMLLNNRINKNQDHGSEKQEGNS